MQAVAFGGISIRKRVRLDSVLAVLLLRAAVGRRQGRFPTFGGLSVRKRVRVVSVNDISTVPTRIPESPSSDSHSFCCPDAAAAVSAAAVAAVPWLGASAPLPLPLPWPAPSPRLAAASATAAPGAPPLLLCAVPPFSCRGSSAATRTTASGVTCAGASASKSALHGCNCVSPMSLPCSKIP